MDKRRKCMCWAYKYYDLVPCIRQAVDRHDPPWIIEKLLLDNHIVDSELQPLSHKMKLYCAQASKRHFDIKNLHGYQNALLCYASSEKHTELVHYILDGYFLNSPMNVQYCTKGYCAEPCAKNECVNLSLLYATKQKDHHLVKRLVKDYGGDVDFSNGRSYPSALQSALTDDNLELFIFLKTYSKMTNMLHNACVYGAYKCVEHLLKENSNQHIDEKVRLTSTLSRMRCGEMFLRIGESFKSIRVDTYTPLMVAASSNSKLVRFLLEQGASCHVTSTVNRDTALHVAASFYKLNQQEWHDIPADFVDTLKLLVDAGADINATNQKGHTLLYYLLQIHLPLCMDDWIENHVSQTSEDQDAVEEYANRYCIIANVVQQAVKFLVEHGAHGIEHLDISSMINDIIFHEMPSNMHPDMSWIENPEHLNIGWYRFPPEDVLNTCILRGLCQLQHTVSVLKILLEHGLLKRSTPPIVPRNPRDCGNYTLYNNDRTINKWSLQGANGFLNILISQTNNLDQILKHSEKLYVLFMEALSQLFVFAILLGFDPPDEDLLVQFARKDMRHFKPFMEVIREMFGVRMYNKVMILILAKEVQSQTLEEEVNTNVRLSECSCCQALKSLCRIVILESVDCRPELVTKLPLPTSLRLYIVQVK